MSEKLYREDQYYRPDVKFKSSGSGKVRRAYLVDISPFTPGLLRRVLIDQYGLVFVKGSGWSNLQAFGYKFLVLPGEVQMYEGFKIGWWTPEAWKDPAWAWMHFYEAPEFIASRLDEDGFVWAA